MKSYFATNFSDWMHDMMAIIISTFNEINFKLYKHRVNLYTVTNFSKYFLIANYTQISYGKLKIFAGFYQIFFQIVGLLLLIKN